MRLGFLYPAFGCVDVVGGEAALQKKKNDTNYGATDDSVTISAALLRAEGSRDFFVIFNRVVD